MVAPFTILDTDYDTYSLSWSCVDIGFMGHVEVKVNCTIRRMTSHTNNLHLFILAFEYVL
jgi:hypothetical protein